MNQKELEDLVRQVLAQELGGNAVRFSPCADITVTEADRMSTGDPAHQVYTHDLFSLAQSPRLGAGVMEMRRTTFPWHLSYDEIDYVIAGSLTIVSGGKSVTANPGQVILIPKGSDIQFSVPEFARFLYVTYPADWQNSGTT